MIETPTSNRTSQINSSSDRSPVEMQGSASQRLDAANGSSPVDEITCRRLRARDLRHLASNYRLVHVDQPDSFIERSGPLGLALRGLRPFDRRRPITHLAFSNGDCFLAFAQFRQTAPDRRWNLRDVGLANGLFSPEHVVEDLISYSVKQAGQRGVKRLFARVPSDSPIRLAFDRIGFEAYMGEEIFALDGAPMSDTDHGPLREQDQTDTWAVHQLYHAAVPKQVQFAEAWTSHQWDTVSSKRTKGHWRSFVLEDGYQIVAYARVRIGANAATIEVMYLPENRQKLELFCQGVIDRAMREGGARRLFIPVRAYQAELTTILERLGFNRVGQQELLIKYTAAKVTAKAPEAVVLAPADVRERIPERVPTFLSRRPEEKSSA